MKTKAAMLAAAICFSTSARAADVQWTLIENNLFIDESSEKDAGFERKSVNILINYDEISSAQMFGLSEVDSVILDCLKSRYTEKKAVWYTGHMALGPISKIFENKSSPKAIPSYLMRTFAKLCAP